MKFSLSPAGSITTESSSDFFDAESNAIGHPQDPGKLTAPEKDGDMGSVGKPDHVDENEKYFKTSDFPQGTSNLVNQEGDDDDFDGDDEASEEQLKEHLHLAYHLDNAIREHGLDPAVESLIQNTNIFDLSVVTQEDVTGLEDYSTVFSAPNLSSEDYAHAAAYTIANLQATIRDRRAGI